MLIRIVLFRTGSAIDVILWRLLGHFTMLRFVLALFLLVPTPAFAAWNKATSDHFIVYGEIDAAQLRTFVERVEKFDATMRGVTGLKDDGSPNKLMIFVVRNITTLQQLIGPGSKNVYGFYAPQITGSIAVVPKLSGTGEYDLDSETVLYHEYAHHFMLQYFAVSYPAWYIEGFAEYYSTTEFKKDGTIAVGMPAKHRFASLVLSKPFPLNRMFAPDERKMSAEDQSSFYSYAWLLTHYLRFDPARKGQLTTYLKAFAAGTAPLEAATSSFGDIKKLEQDLQKYMRGRRMSYASMSGSNLPVPTIITQPLTEADGAIMPLYMRMARGTRSADDVASFVADARIMATRYPSEPRALECLAEGELDAEQYAAASKANDALLALRADDAPALLRRARIATARMTDTNDYTGGWKAIRGLIVKANRALPNDPFPLIEYFRSFGREGIEPTLVAEQGLQRAVELAPQISQLRFTLGRWLMFKKRKDEAKIVLAPLINDPHSPGIRETARAILDGTKSVDDPPSTETEKAKPVKSQ